MTPGDIHDGFESNLRSVAKLVHFDRELLTLAVNQLEILAKSVKQSNLPGVAVKIDNTAKILRDVRNTVRSR